MSKFKLGDVVIDNGVCGGPVDLKIIGMPTSGVDGDSDYRLQVVGGGLVLNLPEDRLQLVNRCWGDFESGDTVKVLSADTGATGANGLIGTLVLTVPNNMYVHGLPKEEGEIIFHSESNEYWNIGKFENVNLMLVEKGENSMCGTTENEDLDDHLDTQADEVTNQSGTATEAEEIAKKEEQTKADAEKQPAHGRFYMDLGIRMFFETVEQRDHFVKEHAPVPFEGKNKLLETGEFSFFSSEDGEEGRYAVGELK